MEISWLGWFKPLKLGQATGHLILEFTSPNHANAAIDKSLVISSCLKTCRVYNRTCKIQHCFNCQNYGYNTPQCINPVACCQCAGAHNSRECPGALPHKCAAFEGAHTAFHKSCRLQEQEILRLLSARAETPARFPTKPTQSVPPHSNTSLDDLIRIGPTNRGRAYTRGGRGGRGGNSHHESQNFEQQQQNIHDTRSS